MKLVKYVNGAPIETALDRLWNFPSLDRFFDLDTTSGEAEAATRSPRTNIRETDESYEFTLEMPGLTKEDIELAIEKDRLVVRGGSESKTEENTKDLVRREFRSSRYERSFGIGNGIDREKISAKLENGVLTVTVPKAAAHVGRRIEIA